MRLRSGALPRPRPLLAAFNGAAVVNTYKIGFAYASSVDHTTWQALAGNPAISPGTGWEATWVAQPCLVWDGSQFVAYYTGTDNTNLAIGRATAPSFGGSWTKYASNPVVAHGAGGAPDEVGAGMPIVHYDPADSPAWKMWYHAFPFGASPNNPTGLTVCFADSTDGITWTKRGVVIPVGAAGAFNDIGTDNGAVYKSGSTWYVFASGYHNPGTGIVSKSAYCTCTDPANAATYSVLTQLTNYTGNVTVGGKTWQSNQPRAIIPNPDGDTGYLCWLTLWNPTVIGGLIETCAQVVSLDLTSWGLPSALMLPGEAWDTISAENPAVILAP